MAPDGQSKLIQTPTTAQQLGAIIKSARDIMRKDKGLSGDLDRLPMLTWIMFLKFLDDTEQIREEEASLSGATYRPVVEAPYRWRDWAAKEDGITGDELISFVNNEEAVRPDGTWGPGLFAYLRSLQSANGGDRRDVVATVFRGAVNRMINGYLLRDVINKVNAIDFGSTEEIHTLGHLYESMLKEMRDAAGDSGEFYTPRPVVRFMVEVVDPCLGETVLDPACGTGGFLSESFSHMREQCETVQDRETLQTESIYGGEAKPLPYLMAQMNLLLHGLESPNIDPMNSLRFPLQEMGERDRVDVILTNPPFGGEEERGIQNNFPVDRQTSETALLFLQLIMRKLRRHSKPGRAGVIVPDGVLTSGGVGARIKEELLREFNLHTIVRLPSGVFAPYTSIPTNLLFFDRSGPTDEVWYYEQPLPEGCKNYTKTNPISYEELSDCLAWWEDRKENEHAWKVPAADIVADRFNLDIKNPAMLEEDHSIPLSNRNTSILESLDSLSISGRSVLQDEPWESISASGYENRRTICLDDVLQKKQDIESVRPDNTYSLLGVRLAGDGPYVREKKLGWEISSSKLNKVSSGNFIYSRLFAWRGAFGIVPEEFDGHYVSNEFPTYEVDSTEVLPEYLQLYFTRPAVWREVEKKCQGTTKASRNRFKEMFLLNMRISVPAVEEQHKIVELTNKIRSLAQDANSIQTALADLPLHLLAEMYRGDL